MSFFNPVFAFVFIPLVVIIYNLFPKKLRAGVLLAISLLFFAFVSKWLIIYLLFSIVSVYVAGIAISKLEEKKKAVLKTVDKEEKKTIKASFKRKQKFVLVLCIIFNVAFLFFFKYLNFFAVNANLLMDYFKIGHRITIVKHVAPIGISFYTLEALSYVLDIYYGKIQADKNILRVALYLAFFPQLLEGPIARYSDTAESLYAGNKVTVENFNFGLAATFGMTLGLLNMIPYFGALIGGVVFSVIVLLSENFAAALFIAIYIVVMQQIDANIIQPRIIGENVGIRAIYVLLGITVFGGLLGFWGIFFGAPFMAVIQLLLTDYIRFRKQKAATPVSEESDDPPTEE